MAKGKFLLRYTNLAVVIQMLQKMEITLRDPKYWADKTDAMLMEEYCKAKRATSVAAVCFTMKTERSHHWPVFAGGTDGMCVEFNKEMIERSVANANFRSGEMNCDKMSYKHISELDDIKAVDELPFLKRKLYEHENEFRVVYSGNSVPEGPKLPINVSSIKKISVNPLLGETLANAVGNVLRAIPQCESLEVDQSKLHTNRPRWEEYAKKIVSG